MEKIKSKKTQKLRNNLLNDALNGKYTLPSETFTVGNENPHIEFTIVGILFLIVSITMLIKSFFTDSDDNIRKISLLIISGISLTLIITGKIFSLIAIPAMKVNNDVLEYKNNTLSVTEIEYLKYSGSKIKIVSVYDEIFFSCSINSKGAINLIAWTKKHNKEIKT